MISNEIHESNKCKEILETDLYIVIVFYSIFTQKKLDISCENEEKKHLMPLNSVCLL